MKKILIFLLLLIFILQLVNAAEVCVVVDYRGYSENEPDSKCVDIEEGRNGYDLLNRMGWDLSWSPETAYGHMLCKINDVGTEVSGQYCAYSGDFWNIVLNRDGKWLHLPVGFDGPGGCWNYDINSWDGHYCTKGGDVLGFAFGSAGSEPEMFKVNMTKIYVDGKKQTDSNVRKGKITDVFPNSKIELKIELENLYDSGTDIEIIDISIKGTIEEIDNGDDIEEEISEFDLKADMKTSKTINFEIPLEVEAKDRLLKIEVKAKGDAGIKYEKEFSYDLEIEKKEHELKITKADLDKSSYKCGTNALLDFSIINIGTKNENVKLKIVNKDLSLNINTEFELSNNAFEESSKYGNRFNMRLPSNISAKTYPITITAEYGSEKEIENINLVVSDCEKKETTEKTEEAKESEEFIEVQAEQEAQEEEIEIGKEKEPKEIPEREEKINKNLSIVLMAVLGILVLVIIVLFVMFWVVRK